MQDAEGHGRTKQVQDLFEFGNYFQVWCFDLKSMHFPPPLKQVRLVSVEAERPNHPSRRGEGVASQGGGVLHDNNDNADVTL